MKTKQIATAFALAMLTALVSLAWAAGEAQSATQGTRYDPAGDPDKRMSGKVAFEALHARLSTAVADLSKATGVIITCGDSKDDWRVRDIPVTIYAKDIALGKLLRTIAYATYTTVGSSNSNGQVAYKIFRDPSRTQALEDYQASKLAFDHAQAARDWDAAVFLKDIPDDQIAVRENTGRFQQQLVPAFRKKLAVLLAAMGPEYKQQMLDGKRIFIRFSDAPAALREPLRAVITAGISVYQSQVGGHQLKDLTPDELEKSTFDISDSVAVHSPSDNWGERMAPYNVKITDANLEQKLQAILRGDGKYGPMEPMDRTIFRDFPQTLTRDKPLFVDNKVSLDDLKGKAGLTEAEVAFECAKRGGFSIVLMDWDYKIRNHFVPRLAAGQDTTIAETLQGIGFQFCFIDEEDHVVVGSYQGMARFHRDLVPAAFLDNLHDKMNGSGADFEDMLPIASMTQDQYSFWILHSKDFDNLPNNLFAGDPIWQFYISLSAADRAQAATDAGLPLAKFDVQKVMDVLTSVQKRNQWFRAGSNTPPGPDFTDAKLIPTLTLHLFSRQMPFRPNKTAIYGPGSQIKFVVPQGAAVPRGLDYVRSYSLEIKAPDGAQGKILISSVGPVGLPCYSKEREEELMKSVTGESKPTPVSTGAPAH